MPWHIQKGIPLALRAGPVSIKQSQLKVQDDFLETALVVMKLGSLGHLILADMRHLVPPGPLRIKQRLLH